MSLTHSLTLTHSEKEDRLCTVCMQMHENGQNHPLLQGFWTRMDSMDDVVDMFAVDNLSIGTERSETPALDDNSFSIRCPEAEPLHVVAPRSPPPIVPPLVLPLVLSLYSGAEYGLSLIHI